MWNIYFAIRDRSHTLSNDKKYDDYDGDDDEIDDNDTNTDNDNNNDNDNDAVLSITTVITMAMRVMKISIIISGPDSMPITVES